MSYGQTLKFMLQSDESPSTRVEVHETLLADQTDCAKGWLLMTAFYQQVYRMVVSGTASSAVFADLQSLNAGKGEVQGGLLSLYRHIVKSAEPKADRAVEKVVSAQTSRPISAPARDAVPGPVRLLDSGFRLGDVVRSHQNYWKRTRREISGAILRFEPVPAGQIAFVGSDHWAYLNSGEGPVSLAIIEQVPDPCGEAESGDYSSSAPTVALDHEQAVSVR